MTAEPNVAARSWTVIDRRYRKTLLLDRKQEWPLFSSCAQWYSIRPNSRCNCATFPNHDPLPEKSSCAFPPAPFAGPIFILSMANYRSQNCRWFPDTKSWDASKKSDATRKNFAKAIASVFHGWAGLVGNANFADPVATIFAIVPA